jgi:hypothetical protein
MPVDPLRRHGLASWRVLMLHRDIAGGRCGGYLRYPSRLSRETSYSCSFWGRPVEDRVRGRPPNLNQISCRLPHPLRHFVGFGRSVLG